MFHVLSTRTSLRGGIIGNFLKFQGLYIGRKPCTTTRRFARCFVPEPLWIRFWHVSCPFWTLDPSESKISEASLLLPITSYSKKCPSDLEKFRPLPLYIAPMEFGKISKPYGKYEGMCGKYEEICGKYVRGKYEEMCEKYEEICGNGMRKSLRSPPLNSLSFFI